VGRKLTLVLYLFGAAIGAYFFGQEALIARDVPAILVWGSVVSFFNLGAWGVVYTYSRCGWWWPRDNIGRQRAIGVPPLFRRRT
jgi:hypothetical protein